MQYAVSGTGTMDGTSEYGRARLTVDPGVGSSGIVRFAAKLYGSAANAITLQYIDAGAGVTVPQCVVQQLGPAITVLLSRNALAITATAKMVADAINAFTGYTSPAYAIRALADFPLATTVLAATAPLQFTGGYNPELVGGSQFLWTPSVNTNVGYLDVEQQNPMWVLGFAAKFDSVPVGQFSVRVSRVRLDEIFRPIVAEAIPLFVYDFITTSAPDISYADVRQVVHPGQGLLVQSTTNTPGLFNFDFTRAAEFPYA